MCGRVQVQYQAVGIIHAVEQGLYQAEPPRSPLG